MRIGVVSERAARLGHLHEREHPFVHASPAARADDDHREPASRRPLDRAGDFFADDAAHGCCEKLEIHHRDAHFLSGDAAGAADDGVLLSRGDLILLEPVCVARLACEFQRIHRRKTRIVLDESALIDQERDAVRSGDAEVVLALGADAIIVLQFQVVDDFATAWALGPKPRRKLAFFVRSKDGLVKNSHIRGRSVAEEVAVRSPKMRLWRNRV